MNGHIEKKRLDNPPATIKLKIQRREKEGAPVSWETFELTYRRNLNVISALMDVRKNPVTIDGKATTPPVWDMSCLEQVCGICTMVIDDNVRQCAKLRTGLPDEHSAYTGDIRNQSRCNGERFIWLA